MSAFDFRDMLGGADARVAHTDPAEAIGQIGERMCPHVVFMMRRYHCTAADVIASTLTHTVVQRSLAGQHDLAIGDLQHIIGIATGLIREIEAARG